MSSKVNRFTCRIGTAKFAFSFCLFWLAASTEVAPQNFWQQTNGPYGGFIRALAINLDGSIFAGNLDDGVFRSTDNGLIWTLVSSGLTNTAVSSLAINANGHIFVGTAGGGIFRSTDNGGGWMPVNTGLTATNVQALAINSSGYIFAGTTFDGVFRSTDNGDNWISVNAGLMSAYVRSFAINSTGHIFAGTNDGKVFRSTNNGNNWAIVYTGSPYSPIWCIAINASGNVFAGTTGGVVLLSVDNGGNWTSLNIAPASISVYALAINSSGIIFAGTGGGGFFRSTDNGSSWVVSNAGATNLEISSLAVNASGHIFAGTAGGGVLRSTDNGSSWMPVNTGLTNPNVLSFAVNVSGYIFAGTFGGGIFRSIDNGSEWLPVNTDLTSHIVHALTISPVTQDIFAGTLGGGVFRSADNGGSWTAVNTGLTHVFVYTLAVNSSGHIFAGTSGGKVFRSTDNGGSWIPVHNGLTSADVRSLAINSSGYIFAGTSGGGAFRSTDNGDTWTHVGLAGFSVLSFAISSRDHIFAGTDFLGVFRSTDDGSNWIPFISINVTGQDVYSIVTNMGGQVFVGTGSRGVLRSTINGDNWMPLNRDLADLTIPSLALDLSGYVFAGTGRSGVYRSLQSTLTPNVTVDSTADVSTTSATLRSIVSPNGFITTIKFQYGISTNYGSEVAVPSPVTGDSAVSVNILLTGLAPATLYHFRVVATNSAGITEGQDQTFNTLPCGAIVILHTPPPPSQEPGREIKVTADISTDCGLSSAILHYRQGRDTSFVTVPMPDAGSAYRWTIPGFAVTPRGIEYSFVVTDLGGRTVFTPPSGFFSHQVSVPNGLVKEEAQPGGIEQTGYRLISVPLDLKKKKAEEALADDFGDYQNSQWRFYELRDNYVELPASAPIYSEYPNTSEIKPGKAFWLIVREPGKRLSTGAGISMRTDTIFTIPLHRGWNFVGNPFYFPIPLSKVRLKKTQQSPVLRYYESKWNNTQSDSVREIEPFAGYALSVESPDTLLINPDLTDSTNTLSKTNHTLFSQALQWSIQIVAQCQEARDIDNIVAVAANASHQRDDIDLPEPPVIGEYVSVYFPHREWSTLAKTYCVDARPKPAEGEVWEFEVKTNIRDKVNLTFENLESVPPEFEIWLTDDALRITQNLRESNGYLVAGSEHPKSLKLVVGKQDFIKEKLAQAQLIPTHYELSQNFPNPFNPVTTIRYGLPQAGRVSLKIYNLLGEEVTALVDDEQKAAGYHVAIWEGRDKNGVYVASGVYVYRMRSGSYSTTKKLALVK